MRSTSFASLLLFAGPLLAVACSSSDTVRPDDYGTTAAAQTVDELALDALRTLGAKVEGRNDQCQRCHDINKASLRRWAADHAAITTALNDTSITAADRVNKLRRNPADSTSTFTPAHIGFLAAGAHHGVGPHIDPTRHPKTLAQGQLLKSIFASDTEYARFRSAALMPVDPELERLTATEYETVLNWVSQGMPKLDELLVEEPRPTTCTDNFTELKTHARNLRTTGWAAVNRDNHMPMFACAPNSSPLECFKQQRDGQDVFADARNTTFGAPWAAEGSTVRVLRELNFRTSFWARNSADGRFVGNGVSSGGQDRGVVTDLGAALNAEAPRTRDIWVNASYDPSFWPDNAGFLFQGAPGGAAFCTQSLLTNPATANVTFSEGQCSKLGSTGLYQSIGQLIGDNSFGDHFIVTGKFMSDHGGALGDTDPRPSFGPDAKAVIQVMTARGGDPAAGYEIGQRTELATPFEGDVMMSPTTSLLVSRVAGETDQLGYMIRRLTATMTPTGYRLALREAGRICLPGGKANFSFDERFLVTYHYLTRADFASDEEFAPYATKKAADLYVVDLLTGDKQRVTRMAPGQFAVFPHYRSDGWLYFMVHDANTNKEYIAASDVSVRRLISHP